MKINETNLLGYSLDEGRLTLILGTDSLDVARSCVSDSILVVDGVGNQANRFTGYSTIMEMTLNEVAGTVTVVLSRDESYDAQLAAVTAKLHAAMETNAFLEECIVEMAEMVYA